MIELSKITNLSLPYLQEMVVKTNPILNIDNVEKLDDMGMLRSVIEFNVLYDCLCADLDELDKSSDMMFPIQCKMDCLDETIIHVFDNPLLSFRLKRLWLHKPYFLLLNTRLANLCDEFICHNMI